MAFMRLDKFLSTQAGVTRSEAKELLKSLKVKVNGETEKLYSRKINTDTDTVFVNGKEIAFCEHIYLLMNKPGGVLTATEDKTRKTVLDLVPPEYMRKGLAPVGRLDRDTTGLLFLTDDGVFAHKIISPKSMIEKEYSAVLDGNINEDAIKAFKAGIVLASGEKCMPATLVKTGENTANVIIKEGKYHQIKRMFGVVGLGVNQLKRTRIGDITLPDGLPEGNITVFDKNLFDFTKKGK